MHKKAKKEPVEFFFKESESFEDCLELLTAFSLIIDFYLRRSENYNLFDVAMKIVTPYHWKIVAKHIVTKSGVSLESVPFETLGGVNTLHALGAFCKGLEELKIPDVYKQYCSGVTVDGLTALIRDAKEVEKACLENASETSFSMVGKLVAELFGRSLAT